MPHPSGEPECGIALPCSAPHTRAITAHELLHNLRVLREGISTEAGETTRRTLDESAVRESHTERLDMLDRAIETLTRELAEAAEQIPAESVPTVRAHVLSRAA